MSRLSRLLVAKIVFVADRLCKAGAIVPPSGSASLLEQESFLKKQ
jgi:hypothetical protein